MPIIHDKIKPVVVKALAQADSPEAERSLAWTTIHLLGRRLDQLEAEISFAETQRQEIRKLRDKMLDTFPEGIDP